MRIPKLFNLRADRFERGDDSIFYDKWFADRAAQHKSRRGEFATWYLRLHDEHKYHVATIARRGADRRIDRT